MGLFKQSSQIPPLDVDDSLAIVVDQVTKVYSRNDKTIKALNNVSFSVKKGEFFSIVGRSGSGKTSLLNIMGAMEKPTEGRIAINGKTLTSLSEKELTQIRRDEISTIYQSFNLIPVLTAFQNVELPMILKGISKEERKERAIKLLNLVGLKSRMDHKPDELSGGEMQRVTIARALSNQPSIILADEPTGSLDEEIGHDIINLLEGINRDLGTTLIMVTHDNNLSKRADRILKIKESQIEEIIPGDGELIRKNELSSRQTKELSYY
ncbi:MAG: ABC transporter ATP-binding protein [Candidatus Heimdallarchaeota archaeon]|nr:ABC transporter ATP-binding protein [Candidatus Heimdallarchaeota archaeon]